MSREPIPADIEFKVGGAEPRLRWSLLASLGVIAAVIAIGLGLASRWKDPSGPSSAFDEAGLKRLAAVEVKLAAMEGALADTARRLDVLVAETKPKAEHLVEQRPTQTEKLYTVRPGDSLSRISQNACGGGKRIDISTLRRANASVLKADSIQPGMKLFLPCPE